MPGPLHTDFQVDGGNLRLGPDPSKNPGCGFHREGGGAVHSLPLGGPRDEPVPGSARGAWGGTGRRHRQDGQTRGGWPREGASEEGRQVPPVEPGRQVQVGGQVHLPAPVQAVRRPAPGDEVPEEVGPREHRRRQMEAANRGAGRRSTRRTGTTTMRSRRPWALPARITSPGRTG